MRQNQSLLFVTGTRADFGKIEPLARAAVQHGFEVSFFVTGMHMMHSYGLTKLEVQRLPDVTVHEFLNQRPGDPQDVILAKTMLGFSDFVVEKKPDLVLVHGDRVEAMACALVCATNYIKCAHIEGGEVSGTIDEVFRHCNSKLAYCHFVSSKSAGKRVQALGEAEETIHVIGSPELDFHSQASGFSIEEVRAHYQIDPSDYGICILHPVTSETNIMRQQASDLFEALKGSGKYFVVIRPNNDPGSEDIIAVIDALPKSQFKVIPSMSFGRFSELLKNAACIVGNSSAGVREAPFLGVPSLDVGSRQSDRAFGPSITKADAGQQDKIARFLQQNWHSRHPRQTEFGHGNATRKFIDILKSDAFWQRSMQKYFNDFVQ
ncbi:UDP-N-acetylglucosamine 2-epimerase [Paracoccaceae bacterium]|nr:UDP-N-acetylglucosamine 2-epimerase [Paracoccaceae bacterium]MDC0430935.1 UDP-N-acetylglucosamine 2-epimerase [Paracoccaceae bacterium]